MPLWAAVVRVAKGAASAVRGAATRFRTTRAGAGSVIGRPGAVAEARPSPGADEFLKAIQGLGERKPGRLERLGLAMWGLDALKGRYDRAAPTFIETLQVNVQGQRWATVEDLYILAMCVVVDLVDGRNWQGGQGVRCLIDRTAKYVEVEFQQTKQGLAEATVTGLTGLFSRMGGTASEANLFHNPDWLSNEIKIPSKVRTRERIPDVLLGAKSITGAWADRGRDRNDLIDNGNYTANRIANQTAAESADGIRLVTHEREVNPAPIADGLSRGTDLTALLAQALHESCDPPPVPETDRQYHLDDPPEWGGCNWPVRVDGPAIHRRFLDWWLGFFRIGRWVIGWRWAVGRPGQAGGLVVDPARPNERTPC
jgi:hypothetical protein